MLCKYSRWAKKKDIKRSAVNNLTAWQVSITHWPQEVSPILRNFWSMSKHLRTLGAAYWTLVMKMLSHKAHYHRCIMLPKTVTAPFPPFRPARAVERPTDQLSKVLRMKGSSGEGVDQASDAQALQPVTERSAPLLTTVDSTRPGHGHSHPLSPDRTDTPISMESPAASVRLLQLLVGHEELVGVKERSNQIQAVLIQVVINSQAILQAITNCNCCCNCFM